MSRKRHRLISRAVAGRELRDERYWARQNLDSFFAYVPERLEFKFERNGPATMTLEYFKKGEVRE